MKPESVSNLILEELGLEPKNTATLLAVISENYGITKQGFYRALRQLIKNEVAVKHKQMVSLNALWLANLEKFIKTKMKNEIFVGGEFIPKKGFGVRKTFRTTIALDIYWGHLFLLLAEQMPTEPIFAYNPHEWFVYDRPESEKNLFNWIRENKRMLYLTIGKDTFLSKKFKRDSQNKNIEIAIEDFKYPIQKNIAVVGPYVIYTSYDKKMSEHIDQLLSSVDSFGQDEKRKLQEIILNHKKSTLTIEHNELLAKKIKKRFLKNFYIEK